MGRAGIHKWTKSVDKASASPASHAQLCHCPCDLGKLSNLSEPHFLYLYMGGLEN